MNEKRKAHSAVHDDRQGRRPWSTPTLARIDAGEAEIGTRASALDGGFTTS
jgi:hypothetical protein